MKSKMSFERNQKTILICFVWSTLLCSSTTLAWTSYQSGDYDDDHVDFTDMGSYNHGFQKNVQRKNSFGPPGGLEEETVKVTRYKYESSDPSFDELEGSLSTKVKMSNHHHDRRLDSLDNSGLKTIEIIESSKKYQTIQPSVASLNDSTSMKFLKRIVASLLRQMNVRSHVFGPGEAITIDLQAEISHANFMTLNKFVSDENVDGAQYLTQVDVILSNMLHVVTAPLTPNFFETLKDGLQSLFTAFITPKSIIIVSIMSLFVFMVSVIAWRIRYTRSVYQMVWYGFIIVFLVSCVWTFIAMYEDSKAKNYTRMMQTQEVPSDCEFDRMGIWDSMPYFFRVHVFKYEDRCVEYHKEVMVDPFWRTSPTEAISHTFASLIFHPAEYVGSKLGKFFYNASNVFPFWMQPFVLLLLFIFVFLGVFRYKISTPFISIEPGSNYNNNGRVRNSMLNDSQESSNRLESRSDHDQKQTQIAEKPAAEVVEVKTRDACVDTSDFEEYLRSTQSSSRSRRQSETEDLPEHPELPSTRRYNFQFFTSWIKRSSLLYLILSGVFNIVVLILDKALRQVPFIGFETNSLSTDFAIP